MTPTSPVFPALRLPNKTVSRLRPPPSFQAFSRFTVGFWLFGTCPFSPLTPPSSHFHPPPPQQIQSQLRHHFSPTAFTLLRLFQKQTNYCSFSPTISLFRSFPPTRLLYRPTEPTIVLLVTLSRLLDSPALLILSRFSPTSTGSLLLLFSLHFYQQSHIHNHADRHRSSGPAVVGFGRQPQLLWR